MHETVSKIYPYIRRSTPHVAVCAWDQSSGLLPAACTAESLLWLVALFSNVLHEVVFLNISVLEKPAPCRMLCLHTHTYPLWIKWLAIFVRCTGQIYRVYARVCLSVCVGTAVCTVCGGHRLMTLGVSPVTLHPILWDSFSFLPGAHWHG